MDANEWWWVHDGYGDRASCSKTKGRIYTPVKGHGQYNPLSRRGKQSALVKGIIPEFIPGMSIHPLVIDCQDDDPSSNKVFTLDYGVLIESSAP
jgi:hypothetical protein